MRRAVHTLEVMAAFQRDHGRPEKGSGRTSQSSTKTNGKFFTCRGVSHTAENNKWVLDTCQGAENNLAEPGLSEPSQASV